MHNESEIKEFKEWGVTLPSRDVHGTDEDIRSNLKPLKPRHWRQEGNHLIAETDQGTFVQTIPTNYILTGTDAKGLPVFKKIA